MTTIAKILCFVAAGLTLFAPRCRSQESHVLWSHQPLRESDFSSLRNASSTRIGANAIDDFVGARQFAKGLSMAPLADRPTLLRRVTYDLLGLPPSITQIDEFVNDPSPNAFQRVVDRLLASPHYGERWGRHWLDLVRYADTCGNSGDFPVPDAWRYRNYVIDALNADRPYDQFLAEQLAGDLLPVDSERRRRENITATGYLAASRRFGVEEKQFHLTIEDTITNLGQAFLGLSIQCARCHDHMFDEITQEDYYAFYGIFQSTRYAFPGTEVFPSPKDFVALVDADQLENVVRPYERQVKELELEIERLRLQTLRRPEGEERDEAVKAHEAAKQQRVELLMNAPRYPKAYAVTDLVGTNAQVHLQGDPLDLGDEVPRGFLSVFGDDQVTTDEAGSGRLQLSAWLFSPAVRPLTARVIVNRVWQHHFGKGIVQTPNDFGTQGRPPTHPELLDFLAGELIANDWSLKKLHRLILLSHVYRQATDKATAIPTDQVQRFDQIDPANDWLWKFTRRPLSAEELRDTVLLVSGKLNLNQPAGHDFPPEHEWKFGQHTPYMSHQQTRDRSVYLLRQRLKRNQFLEIFDAADPNVTTERRPQSTTSKQALWLMNNPVFHQHAEAFAERLLSAPGDDRDRFTLAHRLLFGRRPTRDELSASHVYIGQYAIAESSASRSQDMRRLEAWASYVRVLMSSNEFLYVE